MTVSHNCDDQSASSDLDDDEVAIRNHVLFEEMKKDPEWRLFFGRKPYELEIGAKFAEGG